MGTEEDTVGMMEKDRVDQDGGNTADTEERSTMDKRMA